MKDSKLSRHLLAGGLTVMVFGLIAFLVGCPQNKPGAVSAPAGPTVASAWPLFGGTLSRNMVNTVDRNIPGDWVVDKRDGDGKLVEKGKNIKWSVPLGSRAYGGPVIANGKIIVGTNNEAPRDPNVKGDKGVIMCFRESDGQFLWQIVHDKLPSGQVHDWPREGICSTPVIEGERLYYTSNRCTVVCADLNTGKIVWQLDMMKDLNVFPHNMTAASPLIAGDILFVVTANGVDEGHINIPSPKAPSFLALQKTSGKIVWQDNSPTIKSAQLGQVQDEGVFDKSPIKRLMDRGEIIMHGQWSNPSYAAVNGKPQVVFPGGNGWLYSFDPQTGKLLWKFDANPKDYHYELGGRGKRSDFIATPVIIGDQVIVGTGQDPEHYEGVGHLWCIDMTRTGDVSPWLVVDEKASPVKTKVNPNSAVVWHYGGPTTKEDQEKIQRDYYFGRTMSTVALHDGLVYAGELAGYLHCLDAKTGKQQWVHDLKSAVWGSAYWVDNKVYIATEDGDVWVFPHGRGKPNPKKFETAQAPIHSTPVACNGVLYVMAESRLYAIANK